MIGRLYIVKKGDTLWDIAERFFGNPRYYPLIFKHNNIPLIVALTKSKIVDADLIYVGQQIYIPDLNHSKEPVLTDDNIVHLSDVKAKKTAINLLYPTYKYSFNHQRLSMLSLGASITLSLTGSITLQRKGTLDFFTMTKDGLELKLQMLSGPYDRALNKLIHSGLKLKYDVSKKSIFFENSLTIHSKNNIPMKSSISVTTDGNRLILKTKHVYSRLSGEFEGFSYKAENFGIEFEITVDNSSNINQHYYDYALLAAGCLIIVATLVEDCLSAGYGIADDPACFAIAAQLISKSSIATQLISKSRILLSYLSSGNFINNGLVLATN